MITFLDEVAFLSVEQGIFYCTITSLWLMYLWETYLSHKQNAIYKTVTSVPHELAGVIDQRTFDKARLYQLDKSNFEFWVSLWSQLETTVIIYGGLPFLWKVSGDIVGNTENETFGFYIKSQIIFFIVKQALLLPNHAFNVFIIKIGGDNLFIYLWVFCFLFDLMMKVLFDYIGPLFDKFTPLPEGELHLAIEELASSIDFPLTKIYVVEGSKSHVRVRNNAYYYGCFKNKNIVLFDTLLEDYSQPNANQTENKENSMDHDREVVFVLYSSARDQDDKRNSDEKKTDEKSSDEKTGFNKDEVLAILACVMGHWKLNQRLKSLIFFQVKLFFSFVVFTILFKNDLLYTAFGFNEKPVFIGCSSY